MAIKTEVNSNEFVDAFRQAGRGDNFTRPALFALYEYFWELSEEMDEDIELDVIAICCEFTEFANLGDLNEAYGREFADLDEVRDHTQVIEYIGAVDYSAGGVKFMSTGFIIGDF
tara:strand:+ start:334 stop:678 length:345 start_codon:yes stop_codon:yes gene_type:complete